MRAQASPVDRLHTGMSNAEARQRSPEHALAHLNAAAGFAAAKSRFTVLFLMFRFP